MTRASQPASLPARQPVRQLVTAAENIPFGAPLLVRIGRAHLARDGVVNATAPLQDGPPSAAQDYPGFRAGRQFFVTVEPVVDTICLHTIANGPIMDPCRIYLPAGRITEAQLAARTRAAMAALAPEGEE